MAQFLVMVRVPEVEPHIAGLRARFDPSAKRGLGAHVTVVHSNIPPQGLGQLVVERIAAAAASVAPFDYRITRMARFPGTLYLAVEPAEPFVLLKARVLQSLRVEWRERVGEEPFIPHISVVRKSATDDREVESELAATLQRHGPIRCTCQVIVLLENSSGGVWRALREFSLSGDTGSPWPGPS